MVHQSWHGGASEQLTLENCIVLHGKVTAPGYCTIIDGNLFQFIEKCYGDKNKPFTSQQDSASPHAERYTVIYILLNVIQ